MSQTARSLIDAIREEFRKELQYKTGWGRNEVMQVFERAVISALTRFIQLEEKEESHG